jgi:NADPH-dependent 2,4-dienoyl-CoA reductase/sulfur reductase-like enzyme
MTASTDVLVVGGSVAGLRTAEALRRLSYTGTVTILEAGDELPYDRTALSKKVLSPDGDAASIRLRSQGDLDRLGIDFRLRSSAESLDVSRQAVRLADGTAIEYSVLVVATGSTAVELPGVSRSAAHYLRTLADARGLRHGMESARRAVVVGAGFIGSEVAAAISTRGAEVTVIEPASFPLGRVLGEVVGARLAELHESRGVRIVPGRAVTAVHQIESVVTPYQVVLDDGTSFDSDLVIVGIGARANAQWLDGSGVEVADGVVCDEFCRAGAAGVFAVGDVARWPNLLFDETMRVEHWTNAMEQAVVVAWNIVNPESPRAYAPVPYVWSDQHGLRLQIVGRPRPGDEVSIIEDDPANAVLVAVYARQGRLSGGFALNAPARAIALRRSLAARASLKHALDIHA